MRLVAHDGVGARKNGGSFINVPKVVKVHDVLLDLWRQRIVDEALVVLHLLLHLGGDEYLIAGLFDPQRHELPILRRTAFIIGDLLRGGMQWIEFRRALVVHAGKFGRVGAQFQSDEFPLLQSELFHGRQSTYVISYIDAEAAVRTKSEHRCLDASALEDAQ